MSINDYIDDRLYLAHKKEGVLETLQEHSDLVFDYYKEVKRRNGVDRAVDRLLDRLAEDEEVDLSVEGKELLKEAFDQAVYLHDLGKVNVAFQVEKMGNDEFHLKNTKLKSHHSILSSVMYLDIYKELIESRIEDDWEKSFVSYIVYLFSYVISRHHSYLNDLSEGRYEKALKRVEGEYKDWDELFGGYKNIERLKSGGALNYFIDVQSDESEEEYPGMEIWLLVKLLFSSMVASDFLATYEFMVGEKPVLDDWEGDYEKLEELQKHGVFQNIDKMRDGEEVFDEESINRLRSEMLLEAEETLCKHTDKGVFYLEAPTGAGKTITSVNLAKHLLNSDEGVRKWLYIFPFNTLVEQTEGVLNEFLKDEFKVINSTTPLMNMEEIKEAEKEDESMFGRKFLQKQMMQYRSVITSHVNLFSRMFGNGREANLSFVNLSNSVVVIDEVQSYNNELWLDMIKFMHLMSDVMNVKFVIMSATLPVLSEFVGEKDMVRLIQDREKYFLDEKFKNRVVVDTEWLTSCKDDEDVLANMIEVMEKEETKKHLVMLNTKKKARWVYEELRNHFDDRLVLELTGDDNKYVREKTIEKVKEEGVPCILVATQVIEAGVDIDMDIGYKDISKLDAEEQFLGRINRSCKREGKAYFFDMGTGKIVFKKDPRIKETVKSERVLNWLNEKDFSEFYGEVVKLLTRKGVSNSSKGLDGVNDLLDRLDFKKLAEHMVLINQSQFDVFLNYRLKREGKPDLVGSEVWESFKGTLRDRELGFAEKKVKLMRIQEEMNYFMFSLSKFGKSEMGFPYPFTEEIGEIYYMEDGDEYMIEDNGLMKFSKELLEEGGMFL